MMMMMMIKRHGKSFGFAAALLAIAAVLSACSGQRPITAVRDDADFEFRRQNYQEAAVHYQEIVERAPGDWEAQYRLGLSLLALERPKDARTALEQAHGLRPGDEAIADALAEALHATGDTNQLFAFLRQRADETRSTRAYLMLAKYAVATGDMDSASTALLTAIEVDEGRSVDPYLSRAAFAARIGDRREVIRRLRQAYGINPRDARVLAKLEEYEQIPGPTLALPPGR